QLSTRVPREEERAALVVVHVRVAHRRPVDDERVVEQRALAVGRLPELLEEVRQDADVIPVDAWKRLHAVFALAVVRGRMEAGGDAALRVHAVRRVASELEREHTRDLRREGHRLQIEHQLDVLLERVGYADGGAWQLARLAAAVLCLDALNP